jgi:hypothetical protein
MCGSSASAAGCPVSNNHGWSQIGGMASMDIEEGQYLTARFGPKLADTKIAPLMDDRLKCLCAEDDCRRAATQEDGLCDECREAGCRYR